MNLPWDFVGYILIAVCAVVFAASVVVGLLVAVVRRYRFRKARRLLGEVMAQGHRVIRADKGMTVEEINELMDHAEGIER